METTPSHTPVEKILHDMRTPLSIIKLSAEAMSLDPAVPPQIQDELAGIVEQVETLAALMNKLNPDAL